jgi:hypothetical protein
LTSQSFRLRAPWRCSAWPASSAAVGAGPEHFTERIFPPRTRCGPHSQAPRPAGRGAFHLVEHSSPETPRAERQGETNSAIPCWRSRCCFALAHRETNERQPPSLRPCSKSPPHRRENERRPGPETEAFFLDCCRCRRRAAPQIVRAGRVSNRRVGFRFPEGARYPSSASNSGFSFAW